MIYVNEIDPYCAQWLQNLMDAGVLPPGHIDTRSIEDVTPNDLAGYTQCHFFAGLGGWIYALDLAGWPRDRPVWTGSCPCQPFSAAGKGAGFADERHLWPAWQHLIAQRKPATVFGEQVASKAVDDWIDLVHADMEGLGYAFGSVPFPSAGVGAPHIRDRNYWVSDTRSAGLQERVSDGRVQRAEVLAQQGEAVVRDGAIVRLGHAELSAQERQRQHGRQVVPEQEAKGPGLSGATSGFWGHVEWLACADGKLRPVEPGTFPLAHGIPGRVGRLRAYGNAINPHQAAEFVAAFMNADVRQELAAA